MKVKGIEGTFRKHKIKGKEYWYHHIYDSKTKEMQTIYIGKELDSYLEGKVLQEVKPEVKPAILPDYLFEENPYVILGVRRGASMREIKSAYKERSLLYHPDRNNDPSAPAMFRKIKRAYEALLKPKTDFIDLLGWR